MQPARSALPALLALAMLASAGPLSAQPEALDPEALVAQERLRAEVEAALLRVQEPITDADVGYMTFLDTAWALAGLGPDAAPFLIEELEQEDVQTYVVVAYALGLLPTPDTEKALREAMTRADREKGSFAWARKGWAGTALAMQGVEDAVDLPQIGQRPAASFGVFRRTSLLEYAAVMTEPHSLARVLKMFDVWEHEEATGERPLQLRFILRALRWLASPEAVPRVARVLEHPRLTMRVEAATTLSTIDTPESLALLLEALGDEEHLVRRAAALSLEKLRPAGKLSIWNKRLEEEDDPLTRAPLYRLVARDAGRGAAKRLAAYAWSDDALDRAHLVRALGLTDGGEALPLLEKALADSDLRVAANAATTLRRMSAAGARDVLLKGLDAPSPDIVTEVASLLAEVGERRAAPRIAALLHDELAPQRSQAAGRHRIRALGNALVRLDGTPTEQLRRRIVECTDPGSREFLDGLLLRLDALAAHGADDTEAWSAAAASSRPEVRLLSYRKLGEIGDEKAAAALESTFGRVEPDEGAAILDALAGVDSDRAERAIERVLVDPAFDHVHRRPLRHAAAWAARRMGLADVLLRAIERREGRDVWPMIYLAAIRGEDALPVLEKYRRPRLLHLHPRRGTEQEKLDWMAREIREGRSIGVLDVRPDDEIFAVPH